MKVRRLFASAAIVSVALVLCPLAASATTTATPTVAILAGEASPASAPQDVRAQRVPGVGVDLSWERPADDGGSGLDHYVVEKTSWGSTTLIDVAETSWVDPDAAADSTYAVRAVTEVGEGERSTPIAPTSAVDRVFAGITESPRESFTLGVVALPDGTRKLPLAPSPDQAGTVLGLAVTPDGQTLYSVRPSDQGWTVWRQPVDRSTTPVAVWSSPLLLGQLRVSPDGTRVAVSRTTDHSTHVLDTRTGALLRTIPNLDEPDWLPDSRTLVGSNRNVAPEPLIRVDAGTGKVLGTIAGGDGAQKAAVSPEGRWIAFRRLWSGTVGTFIIPVAGGSSQEVTSLAANDVAWSPDGGTLLIASGSALSGYATAPIASTGVAAPAQWRQLRPDRYAAFDLLAWGGPRVSINASAAVSGPQPTFGFGVTGLPSGTTLTCTVDTRAPVVCGTAYKTPALTTGTHTLRVTSASPGGRKTTATRTFTVDATNPAVKLTAPTYTLTSATSVALAYSGSDASGVASYDARYRRAGVNGTFGSYVAWLNGTKSRTPKLLVAAGYRYCVSVRARDVYGNVSAWSPERCVSRLLDDRSMKAATSGWSRVTSSSYYMRTATSTTRKGAALTVGSVRTKQVHLYVTKCSTCGSVSVYVGSAKVGSASLYAKKTANRVLVTLPVTALRSGTLKVLVTSASGKLVRIDGIALRST